MRSTGGPGAASWEGDPAGAAQPLANTGLCGEHELTETEHLLDIPLFGRMKYETTKLFFE